MKRILTALIFLACLSQQAFAGCHDKCIIRNPFSGNCAYQMNVCPLSVETIGHWIDGATPDTIDELSKKLDPTKSLQYYSDQLHLDIKMNADITQCLVSVAGSGVFGVACAAGVAEIGALCFVNLQCLGTCAATQAAFSNGLKSCS